MRVAISEVRSDAEFNAEETAQLVAAIRDACFEAEDVAA